MTLTRSNFLRRAPDCDRLTVPVREAKPAKGPRLKRCEECDTPFQKERMGQKVCSPLCSIVYAKRIKQEQERKVDKVRKQALMTKTDWIKRAQKAFNAWVRFRDRFLPCICCGKFATGPDIPGGKWDAGHYLSRGSASHLRFDERNVFRQLKSCNRPGGTTRAKFRDGVEARIGLAALEALECDQASREYEIADLIALEQHYKTELKLLQQNQRECA